ncbi:ArxX, PhnD/SsuA/transferrin family substrate-binding protein (plasmid) [Cereibacter azotoformans]|uniref:substrate-binding domain-containing protein n=1 Tax=Cereibacter azotoformans TaxID=43057 RepID=UPI001EEB517E|nr:PhnD/SsuA/transferrin family substrate-binding protein [Cereibacter azotoformans]ULB12469.1 ArxX, PhnD/SsuA/transferrin family substrate-binding protein [Cereibacter azotoformans]
MAGAATPTRRQMMAGLGAVGLIRPRAALAGPVGRAFRLGLTPVFLDHDWHLLDLIRAHVSEATGRPVEFVKRRTYKEITALLVIGEIDAAWLCGYPLLQHRDRLSALAVPLWRGAPRYQSYLIAAADRPATRLEDLRGDIHAFSDPDSNSGYLVTVSDLIGMGERPEAFFARSFFTFGHRNVVEAVARRLAASGSVDGYVWEALAVSDTDLVAATRVVRRSDWFGFPPFVIRSESAADAVLRDFAKALFSMPQSAKGREALALLQLDGFIPPPPGAFDAIAARMDLLAGRG